MISVGNRDVEVEISTQESGGQVLVVLKDVTEKRARQEAEREAEKQAMISKTMNESMQKRMQLENKLRTAIFENKIQLNYQPQIDAVSGNIYGVEAAASSSVRRL